MNDRLYTHAIFHNGMEVMHWNDVRAGYEFSEKIIEAWERRKNDPSYDYVRYNEDYEIVAFLCGVDPSLCDVNQ